MSSIVATVRDGTRKSAAGSLMIASRRDAPQVATSNKGCDLPHRGGLLVIALFSRHTALLTCAWP